MSLCVPGQSHRFRNELAQFASCSAQFLRRRRSKWYGEDEATAKAAVNVQEEEIEKQIREALQASDEELDRIFTDEVYEQYVGNARAYHFRGQNRLHIRTM